MKNWAKYEVFEALEIIKNSSDEELSQNALLLAERMDKTADKLKLAKTFGMGFAYLTYFNAGFFVFAKNPIARFISAGAGLIGGVGFLISFKMYNLYKKDLGSTTFMTKKVFEEISNRDKNLGNQTNENHNIYQDICPTTEENTCDEMLYNDL